MVSMLSEVVNTFCKMEEATEAKGQTWWLGMKHWSVMVKDISPELETLIRACCCRPCFVTCALLFFPQRPAVPNKRRDGSKDKSLAEMRHFWLRCRLGFPAPHSGFAQRVESSPECSRRVIDRLGYVLYRAKGGDGVKMDSWAWRVRHWPCKTGGDVMTDGKRAA
jgi:hypothetical protein